MKRKTGFTLVEMLIVVVIIGILAAAILPRLTGYGAKTRDMKRHVDLRNIAAAIQMYKDQHGKMPQRAIEPEAKQKFGTMYGFLNPLAPNYGYASALSTELSPYITSIPTDPNPKSQVKIFSDFAYWGGHQATIRGEIANWASKPGEYVYETLWKNGQIAGGGILIAKAETPEGANYVHIFAGYEHKFKGGSLTHPGVFYLQKRKNRDVENLHLCTSVKKVIKGEETFQIQSDGQVMCTYSSEDQLYYIVKIE